jgi:hypothetical protein
MNLVVSLIVTRSIIQTKVEEFSGLITLLTSFLIISHS